MSKIRILLADDHQMFRTGIANLLNKDADFEVVGETSDGMETVQLALQIRPDIILMDIHLPVLDGIAAARRIILENPDVKVLALTSFEDEDYVMGMIRAGTKGYILKEAPFEELVLAVRTLAIGGSYFAKEISGKLFARLDENGSSPPKKSMLTDRELEVLQYIADELTNKEIGAKLFISPRTVETHRRNLIQKLKVKNTAGLVKFYLHQLVMEGVVN